MSSLIAPFRGEPRQLAVNLENGWAQHAEHFGIGRWAVPCAEFFSGGFSAHDDTDHRPHHTLALKLEGSAVQIDAARSKFVADERCVSLQPRQMRGSFKATGPIRYAHLYLSEEFVRAIGVGLYGDRADRDGLLRDDQLSLRNRDLRSCAEHYITLARTGPTVLEMDSHAVLLGHALIRQSSRLGQGISKSVQGGLAPWQERRVIEFLRSSLDEDVALGELAALAHLSTYHFARMFKRSTGLPPHAYQRRLRCERAKALLISTELAISEIAARVGYETPQAFARMFRAEVGATPSEWRRERHR